MGVEGVDVSTNALGALGIFLEVDAVTLGIGKEILSRVEELGGAFLPVRVVPHAVDAGVEPAAYLGEVLEVAELAHGPVGVVEVELDADAVDVELAVAGLTMRSRQRRPAALKMGSLAQVAHGVDEGIAVVDAEGMDAVLVGQRHKGVPALGEAAVVGVVLVGFG